jgi:mRNA interferase RelE/StbE
VAAKLDSLAVAHKMSHAFYQVLLAKSAARELEKLPTQAQDRIIEVIEGLQSNPRPRGCKKLTGTTNLWRVRSGDYRIIYEINDQDRIVDVNAIRHRSDAYR